VRVCVSIREGEPASSRGALALPFVYTCPRLHSVDVTRRRSEGFGAAGVGHGVRRGFLRVAAVVVHLEQDGEVHQNLQQAAYPELHGSLGEQEVAGFEGVAARPHQHHLDARGRGGGEKRDDERPSLKLINGTQLIIVTFYVHSPSWSSFCIFKCR